MKQKKILSNSLLSELTSSQVQDVIHEYQLTEEGYSFQYVIDHADLSTYCFPFGLKVNDERQSLPVEIVADGQIALHSLFHSRRIKIHFFDEYFLELNKLIDLVNMSKELGIQLFDNLERFREEVGAYQSNQENKNTTINWVDNNLSLLISLAIESLSQGIQKQNKLFKRKNAIVNRHDIQKSSLPRTIQSILLDSKPGSLTEELYKRVKRQILSDEYIDSQIEYKFKNQLLNKYRDCKVIDRLLNINQRIERTEEKYIFLFLSSPAGSKSIFKSKFTQKNFCEFSDIIVNPHRTTSQIFLRFICREKTKTLKNLLAIKKVIQIQEGTPKVQLKKSENEIIEKSFKKIEQYRREFKNLAILNQYEQYKDTIDQAKKLKENESFTQAFEKLITIIENKNKRKEINKLKVLRLNEIKFERNFISSLISGVKAIEEGNNYFRITKGNDYIKGVYHRLPIVFNIKEDKFRKVIDKITVTFVNNGATDLSSKGLLKFIRNSVLLLFDKTTPIEEEKVVRCLVFFILPNTLKSNTDEIVLNRLEEILKFEIDDSNPNNLKQEFLYLASWAARRCTNYKKARKYSEEGINRNKRDARFYHSLALVDYCLFRESIEKGETSFYYLRRAVRNSSRSLNLYNEISHPGLEIEKSKIALINSKIYFYCLLYRNNNNSMYIEAAINLLKKIKDMEAEFYRFPEFIHTESYLHFVIAVDDNTPVETKKQYLKQSIKLIDMAIKLSSIDNEYIEFRKNLVDIQTSFKGK